MGRQIGRSWWMASRGFGLGKTFLFLPFTCCRFLFVTCLLEGDGRGKGEREGGWASGIMGVGDTLTELHFLF